MLYSSKPAPAAPRNPIAKYPAACQRPAHRLSVVCFLLLLQFAALTLFASADTGPKPVKAEKVAPAPSSLSSEEAQSLVQRVLHTELEATESLNKSLTHPMQYRIRKASPRLVTTKLIVETKDGDVARLVAVNDAPLDPEAQLKENARLQSLLDDPSLQHHRQEREQGDTERVRKIIRALPEAFSYQYAGIMQTQQGPSYRFTFTPNPRFDPQDLESQVLKAMAGELWIDVAQQRVTRLDCKRLKDVDYGFGILGKLDQGGTLLLQQAEVGNHQWRTVHMALVMNARFLFKIIKLDTTLELSDFTPVTTDLNYQQAIQVLKQADLAR